LLAEGLRIIKNANAGEARRDEDAENTPLRHPEFYRYETNLSEAQVSRRKPGAA